MTHPSEGMAKRKGKAKPEKTKFTAKQRRLMVEDLEKVDYQDLVDSAVHAIWPAP